MSDVDPLRRRARRRPGVSKGERSERTKKAPRRAGSGPGDLHRHPGRHHDGRRARHRSRPGRHPGLTADDGQRRPGRHRLTSRSATTVTRCWSGRCCSAVPAQDARAARPRPPRCSPAPRARTTPATPRRACRQARGLSSGPRRRRRQGDGRRGQAAARVETEFGTVMARAARDGSTLAEVCRQAWNGEPLSVMNRKRYSASWSHIGIIGHIAPKDFRRRLAAADLAGGTYNRYLPLYVERSKRLPIPRARPGQGRHLGAKLGERLKAAHGVDPPATRTARPPRCGATSCTTSSPQPTMRSMPGPSSCAGPRPTACASPGIYAVLDGRRLISKADLTAAGALVRYSTASARYVLGEHAARSAHGPAHPRDHCGGRGGLTRTEISALFGRNLPAAAAR